MLFSICVPAYNAEKYLKKCVFSVLSQEFENFELIIVDDGSKDSTYALASEYAKLDKRIRVISQENKGLFHTRITAMLNSKGQYIVNLDADDWLKKDALDTLSKYINSNNPDIIIYNRLEKRNNREKIVKALGNNAIIWDKQSIDQIRKIYLDGGPVKSMCLKAIKRELFEFDIIKNYTRLSMSEDWIHSFYPFMNAKSVMYIPDVIYCQRINNGSMTHVFDPSILDSFMIIYKLKMSIPTLKEEIINKWLSY